MDSSLTKKVVAFIICFALIYIPFSLTAQNQYAQGELDGAAQAMGDPLWILGGALCGLFATLWVLLSKPAPPPAALVGKTANYVRGYTMGYQRKTRNKNMVYTLIGWAAWVGVYFAIWGASSV